MEGPRAEPGDRPLAGKAGGLMKQRVADASGMCPGWRIPETRPDRPDYIARIMMIEQQLVLDETSDRISPPEEPIP